MVRDIVIFCVLAELLFVFMDATINYASWTDYGMIRRLVNTAREDSLPSWFGTTQTLMVALTVWLLYLVAKRDGSRKWVIAGWLVLALFFTYMAVDDGAEIHERLGSAFKQSQTPEEGEPPPDTLGRKALDFFPSYSWQVVVLPFFIAMGVFMLFFLWRQLETMGMRLLVVLALALFATGVGLDFIEGLERDHPWNLYEIISNEYPKLRHFTARNFQRAPFDALRHFSKSLEEFIEMLAMTVLWGVFLGLLVRRSPDFWIQFTREEAGPVSKAD
jgi:hypothetical protein